MSSAVSRSLRAGSDLDASTRRRAIAAEFVAARKENRAAHPLADRL